MKAQIKKLFEKYRIYKDATLVNYEGNVAFELSDEDLFMQTLLTNTCSNTFYADKEELVKESIEVHKKMLAKDPKFYAQALVYARTKGFMRLQPVLGLVFLSTITDKSYFRSTFKRVVLTPSDLESFLDLCRSKSVRQGLGRSIKTEIISYLKEKLTEYYAIKYKKALKDAVKLSRPNAKAFGDVKKAIVEYIMRGELTEDLKQAKAVEKLKTMNPANDETEIIKLIEEGRLPYEAVVGAITPTQKIWEALLYQMPIFATLRQINTMARNKVFESEKAVNYVCEKLQHVEESKILPFRFYTAINSLDISVPNKVKDAIVDALEKSFVNMPEIKGKTCIAPDVSGSMCSGKPRNVDIAGIFSAALMKKTKDCMILPVDTAIHPHTCSTRDSIMSNAEKLAKLGGGGTELDLPIIYLLDNKIKVDNYICITDSEEWYSDKRYFWNTKSSTDRGFYQALRDYKNKINPNLKVFYIRIAPYKHSTAPAKEPNLYNIEGWSNTVLDFISTISNLGKDQIDAVKAVEI
ncbi:TROVE domain-containing protein [Candidatus Woesearchaeota archaeon]|nr:TROVE domain-containing protein [Candidatus Woesearchaeota archaeon]